MAEEDVNLDPESPDPIEPEGGKGEPAPAPGSKTPPELLLKSLQEEREKRKELEDRITLLEQSPANPDVFSEEGKVLQRQIEESKTRIEELTRQNAEKDVQMVHPILKEKWEEFEKFRSDPENKGMNLRTAAKAFLVENGLLDAPRKGLERTTGGPRIPTSPDMTVEEIKILRETNFKKYQEMLMKGLIKV